MVYYLQLTKIRYMAQCLYSSNIKLRIAAISKMETELKERKKSDNQISMEIVLALVEGEYK